MTEEAISKTVKCALTDVVIQQCPVASCMWWGSNAPNNCIAQGEIPEAHDISEKVIMRAKMITPEEYKTLRNRGMRAIERLIVINTFVEFLNTKPVEYFKWREAYEDRKLIRYVSRVMKETYPFNVKLIKWDIKKILAALTLRSWDDFYEAHPKIKREPHLRVMGVQKRLAYEIIMRYKIAYKRSLQAMQS